MKPELKLKHLDPHAVPAALAKAERYRLLNEPQEAESICLDILATEPGNQTALIGLLLSLTDQFGQRNLLGEAQAVLPRLETGYDREYYAGIIAERWAKAQLEAHLPGHAIYHWFAEALAHFERAEAQSPAGIEDAILRWNACVRVLHANPLLVAKEREELHEFGDDPPGR